MAESRNPNPGQTGTNQTQAVERQSTQTASPIQRRGEWQESSPFSLLGRFISDMDRMFEDFGFGPAFSPSSRGALRTSGLWSPQVDISERDGRLLVHADLPGLRQEDVHVNVDQGLLTISGERSDAHENNENGVRRRERSYGSFRRSIALPENVDVEKIEASFENGVLEVTMPLPKGSKGRSVPIQPKVATKTGDVH